MKQLITASQKNKVIKVIKSKVMFHPTVYWKISNSNKFYF